MTGYSRIAQSVRELAGQTVIPVCAAALDFVYPPHCLLCGNEVQSATLEFCADCRIKLNPCSLTECHRCGAPVGPFANQADGCGQCRGTRFAFERVIRLGVYEGDMRSACLRAKAPGGSGVARALAKVLVTEKKSAFDEMAIDLAIPIPEHWTRRFLQAQYAAETISREIARLRRWPWSRSLLVKIRRTSKQATSPTPIRRQQQAGSFSVGQGEVVRGKHVLLIDDILTTGSTVDAASKALKQAGAKQVTVAVLAVSPLHH